MGTRIICFRVWSERASFAVHYSTSTKLTYPFIPPSMVRGLVAAILGYDRETYPEALSPDRCRIGIRLLQPVRLSYTTVKHMNTKPDLGKGQETRTFARIEYIRRPSYELYFHHEDDSVMDRLSDNLVRSCSYYTPYLGSAECIASFAFRWDSVLEPRESVNASVLSVIDADNIMAISVHENMHIAKVNVPQLIKADRVITGTTSLVYNPEAKPIRCKVRVAYEHPQTDGCFVLF